MKKYTMDSKKYIQNGDFYCRACNFRNVPTMDSKNIFKMVIFIAVLAVLEMFPWESW